MEDYSFVKQIGKGSYGKVWLIKKNLSNKQYVLKQIDMQNASKQEQCSAYIEVKLLSSLKHPNIVTYCNSFYKPNSILCIVMGYCENGDMYTFIRSHKGLLFPEKQIVEWFVQICMALQYLHERNILHRDLKTQNIFLTKSKIIKVGDLGIARVLNSTCDLATTLIGTPYYMSPELFANQPYNHKSDVWALGCCVYEMATLKHAFNARDLNSLMYKVLLGKLPAMPKEYSAELVELICMMLSYDASCRPTVKCILQNDYVRRHIMVFIQETNTRYQRPSSKYEKCPPVVPNFSVHKSIESDINTRQHSSVQSQLGNHVVSKDTEPPVISETNDSLKIENDNINNPVTSKPQHMISNKKFQERKIENSVNNKAQFFLEVNKTVDILEHFSENFVTKCSGSSDTGTPFEDKQSDGKTSITCNNNELHHDREQNSDREKAVITAPRRRRRQKWQKAHSEGDTANNNSSEYNNYEKNINTHLLPQLSFRSLEDVNVSSHQENDFVHKSNIQQTQCVEQEMAASIINSSQDSCIISKNSEARRRRRERLLQKQALAENFVLPSSEHHENNEAKKRTLNHGHLRNTIKEEKIDAEFQEFIGILDSTLQLKDEHNEETHLTSKNVEKECKNKAPEITASENQSYLIQRRDLLIKDCSLALGDKILREALDAIEYKISAADLQSRLLRLLGKKHLDVYGGKIVQLKMYEDAISAR